MVTANGGGFRRMLRADSGLCQIRSVAAVRPLDESAQHDERCQFLRHSFVRRSVVSDASQQQSGGGQLVHERVSAPYQPFACMFLHDGSHMISWRMNAIRTSVDMPCLCDVARARKYGTFRMRVTLIINSTFIIRIRSQFHTATLYYFRELERV